MGQGALEGFRTAAFAELLGLTWLGVVPVGVAACTALPVMTAKSTAVDSAAQIALNNYVIPVGNIS